VWNAAVQLAALIEGPEPALPAVVNEVGGKAERLGDWDVAGREVLELGAGTGLAGLVAALKGATRTIITDYPATEVLDNLRQNVAANIQTRRADASKTRAADARGEIGEVRVEGHEWGVLTDSFSIHEKEAFDRILVADCLWSMLLLCSKAPLSESKVLTFDTVPHQHINLLSSIRWFLAPKGRAWVVAGFHTGREKMKGFYAPEALEAADLEIESIWEKNADGKERSWVEDRGREDITERKRWLVIGILKRRGT